MIDVQWRVRELRMAPLRVLVHVVLLDRHAFDIRE
jgi:hypothetical protein